MLSKFWVHNKVWKCLLQPLLFWAGDTLDVFEEDGSKQTQKKQVSYAKSTSVVGMLLALLHVATGSSIRNLLKSVVHQSTDIGTDHPLHSSTQLIF